VTDHAGSTMSASATYTLTQVAPTVSVPAPSTSRTVTATVTPGADVKTIVCSVAGPNGLSITPTTCGASTTFTIPASGWDGDYVLTVTVTDHIGATASSSSTYTLTPTAPTVTTAPTSPASMLQPQWLITSDVVDLSGYTCSSSVRVLSCSSTVQLDLTG